MKTMVHCPSCSARLKASKKVAGKRIKCPKCKKPFKVPEEEEELMEDTISCWLEMDREKEEEQSISEAMPESLDDLDDDFHSPEIDHMELSLGDAPIESTAPPQETEETEHEDDLPTPELSFDEEDQGPDEEEEVGDDREPKPPPASDIAAFPATDTKVDAEVKLRVLESNHEGAMMAFDARLLARWSMRGSIPIRCAGCNNPDPEVLTAHPIIWVNRLKDENISAQFLAGRHQMPVVGVDDTRQVLEGLGYIEELNEPYNLPMPYYVCRACGPKVNIEAETRNLEGEETESCVVYLPNPQLALQWLGKVNGVCGDDYLTLRAVCLGVDLPQEEQTPVDDAMAQLPDSVRLKLAEWFKPAGSEKFILYLRDMDYSSADTGRGGVVLTDQRLAYNKYQKHGSVLLNDENTKLLGLRAGGIDDLVAETDGMRNKLVKLKHADTEKLAEALEDLPCRLKLDMVEPEAEEKPVESEKSA